MELVSNDPETFSSRGGGGSAPTEFQMPDEEAEARDCSEGFLKPYRPEPALSR